MKRKYEYSPNRRRKVCIDFDGVLAQYDGWRGKNHHGKPMPGVKKFLKRLGEAEIDFIVFTTRESKKKVINWFKKYNLPLPLDVTNKKIVAAAYVDDRAIYFDGNFNNLMGTLSKFKVHWGKEKPYKALTKKK
jgi:adenylylsulfate kinase